MFETLTGIVKKVTGPNRHRDTLAVFLVGLLGLPAEKLSTLTVCEAQSMLKQAGAEGLQGLKIVDAFVARYNLGLLDLLLRSRKGRGQVPMNRITLWRMFHSVTSHGFRFLQGLAKMIKASRDAGRDLAALRAYKQPVPVSVPTPRKKEAYMDGWSYAKALSRFGPRWDPIGLD